MAHKNMFPVGHSLDSLSSGPQVKEITVIKCHDENRKMSFLLALQRDLKLNLVCASHTHAQTHKRTDSQTDTIFLTYLDIKK